jgi:hypothetical protein
MKARIPDKSRMQELYEELKAKYEVELEKLNEEYKRNVEKVRDETLNACILTRMQADIDSGLAESTVMKTTKRWKSYIDSVHSGNVTLSEIKTTLEDDYHMDFSWMNVR